MKKIIVTGILLCITNMLYAQNEFNAIIKSEKDKRPLAGATVTIKGSTRVLIADSLGAVTINNISAGKHVFTVSYVGHVEKEAEFIFPLSSPAAIEIYLEEEDEESEEIVITSTRTSRTIANTALRVETIDGEELDEKSNMRSANVSMLLHESTGLQVQQTSAVSANASIRVQGLDGRYTQLLKDGYPNFGNFSSGLSIMEIPPLDLKQVEIIKGPASTLYGGGAIAGVVNFIAKKPGQKPEYDFILNQSNVGQSNIGGYASGKKGKFGYTMLGLVNFQKAYDVDKDDFSELPKSNSFTVNPRLFYYPDSTTTLTLGNSFTKGINTGGDMHMIAGKSDSGHVYFEKNSTVRNITTLEIDRQLRHKNNFKIKQSLSIFEREILIPGYTFSGTSITSFSDISYVLNKKGHILISGVNFVFDKFRQKQAAVNDLNNRSFTSGLYVQDTWDVNEKLVVESGIRMDHVQYSNVNFSKSQLFLLPRVSALFRISNKISSRIGGGSGYKTPTIFTEQTETLQYQNVLALNNVAAERSIGGTADINYKTKLGKNLQFSINQMFFYTGIKKPLVLQTDLLGNYFFANETRSVRTEGFETNVKLIFKNDLKLFLGYTFTDAKAGYLPGNQYLPLIPAHKLNMALVYEKEKNLKIGLEGYLTGKQYLYNGDTTPSYWEFGFMAEKIFPKFSVFVNFENFTDQRQSKYKPVVNPPFNNPSFDDVWNHQEGFVMNGGIKIKF